MRHPERHAGPLRQQLANATMALYEQYFGKGPSDCRAYLEADMVVLVLNGGYTAAETTLFEAGRWHDVRQVRLSRQDSMEVRFIETVERLTARTVGAFMSANHQDPDISVELSCSPHKTQPQPPLDRHAARGPRRRPQARGAAGTSLASRDHLG